MISYLKNDVCRIFSSRRFYFAIIGVFAGTLLDFLFAIPAYRQIDLQNILANIYNGGFTMVSYILCTIGAGLNFCVEEKHKNFLYLLIRGSRMFYTASKVLVSALSGFLIMFIGMIGGELAITLTAKFVFGNQATFMNTFDWICNIEDVAVFALLGSLLAVLSFLATMVVVDYFIGTAVPILMLYIIFALNELFHIPEIVRVDYLYFGDASRFPSRFIYGIYVFLYTVTVVYLMFLLALKLVRRRIENA